MSSTYTKLRALANFLEANGLEEVKWEVTVTQRTVWISVWASESDPDQMRKVKRVFGPLKTTGQPPSLYLEGKANDERLGTIDLTVYRAFKCELEGYEEVPMDSEEAQRMEQELREQLEQLQSSGGTKQVPRYRCSPVTAEK